MVRLFIAKNVSGLSGVIRGRATKRIIVRWPRDHVAAFCLASGVTDGFRPVNGRTVLVEMAAGPVGLCAVQLASLAGANVVGTVRSSPEEEIARKAGAHEVVLNNQEISARVRSLAPNGLDHIVEVAFAANIELDVELLSMGGSIATYATDSGIPRIPFRPMVFKNIRLFFLGSDDFPKDAKVSAAQDLNNPLEAGWPGFEIGERIPLAEIARAHGL